MVHSTQFASWSASINNNYQNEKKKRSDNKMKTVLITLAALFVAGVLADEHHSPDHKLGDVSGRHVYALHYEKGAIPLMTRCSDFTWPTDLVSDPQASTHFHQFQTFFDFFFLHLAT